MLSAGECRVDQAGTYAATAYRAVTDEHTMGTTGSRTRASRCCFSVTRRRSRLRSSRPACSMDRKPHSPKNACERRCTTQRTDLAAASVRMVHIRTIPLTLSYYSYPHVSGSLPLPRHRCASETVYIGRGSWRCAMQRARRPKIRASVVVRHAKAVVQYKLSRFDVNLTPPPPLRSQACLRSPRGVHG